VQRLRLRLAGSALLRERRVTTNPLPHRAARDPVVRQRDGLLWGRRHDRAGVYLRVDHRTNTKMMTAQQITLRTTAISTPRAGARGFSCVLRGGACGSMSRTLMQSLFGASTA
jgi:hypothetical protein